MELEVQGFGMLPPGMEIQTEKDMDSEMETGRMNRMRKIRDIRSRLCKFTGFLALNPEP